jgi:hypothetical protein
VRPIIVHYLVEALFCRRNGLSGTWTWSKLQEEKESEIMNSRLPKGLASDPIPFRDLFTSRTEYLFGGGCARLCVDCQSSDSISATDYSVALGK